MLYSRLFKPLLFAQDPEEAHDRLFATLEKYQHNPLAKTTARALYGFRSHSLHRRLWGLDFPNPLGLAAGFDKDARLLPALAWLGFGFVEIGTLTPKPQTGNPKPRLFRLPQDRALVNRMGFNNQGVAAARKRLEKRPEGLIVGGNIGKNKDTPNEQAAADYLHCLKTLYDAVDYFVVNLSSPNTPGLRQLQEKAPLQALLSELKHFIAGQKTEKPLLLKIAPDLSEGQLQDIAEIAETLPLSGLIATNTTTERSGLQSPKNQVAACGNGGLSGEPLRERSQEILEKLRTLLPPNFPLIGVGGIAGPEAAAERLRAGTDLLQVYTGLVYEGPGLPKKINQGLLRQA